MQTLSKIPGRRPERCVGDDELITYGGVPTREGTYLDQPTTIREALGDRWGLFEGSVYLMRSNVINQESFIGRGNRIVMSMKMMKMPV